MRRITNKQRKFMEESFIYWENNGLGNDDGDGIIADIIEMFGNYTC